MKKLLAVAVLSAITSSANAGLINGVNLGNGGNLKFVTSVFFNTIDNVSFEDTLASIPNPDGTLNFDGEVEGVGSVQKILDDNNQVLWSDRQNNTSLWFDFYELNATRVLPLVNSTALFFSEGGFIDFFTTSGVIALSGSYTVDAANVRSGVPFFSGIGDPINGWTTVATSDQVFNTGSGQFIADQSNPGAATYRVNIDGINKNGENTDFTFNYSSDVFNSGGYTYAGSADISMRANPVPAPLPLGLIAMGLVAMGMRRKEV